MCWFSSLDQNNSHLALKMSASVIGRRSLMLSAMVMVMASYGSMSDAKPMGSASNHIIKSVSEPLTDAEERLNVSQLSPSMPVQEPKRPSPLGSSSRSLPESALPDGSPLFMNSRHLNQHWLGAQLGGQGIFTFLYQYIPWSWLGVEVGIGVGPGFIQSSLGLMIGMWETQHWSVYLAGGGTVLVLSEERITESCQDQKCVIDHQTLGHVHMIPTSRIGIAYLWGAHQQHKCAVEGGLWWSTSLLEKTRLHQQGATGMMGLSYLHAF